MEKDVLQLITQALTEGRITEKVHQNEEYNKAKEEETRTYDLLTKDLTEDQKQQWRPTPPPGPLSSSPWWWNSPWRCWPNKIGRAHV